MTRPEPAPQLYVYRWANNAKRATLRGRVCRVICRGAQNSAMVEFADDGQREVISRNALKKYGPLDNLTMRPRTDAETGGEG